MTLITKIIDNLVRDLTSVECRTKSNTRAIVEKYITQLMHPPLYCPTCDPLKEGIGCAGHSATGVTIAPDKPTPPQADKQKEWTPEFERWLDNKVLQEKKALLTRIKEDVIKPLKETRAYKEICPAHSPLAIEGGIGCKICREMHCRPAINKIEEALDSELKELN